MNSMRAIRYPIPKYESFTFKDWDEIFPDFRGEADANEAEFIADLIQHYNSENVIDLGVGEGGELVRVIDCCIDLNNVKFTGIDINPSHLEAAQIRLSKKGLEAKLLNENWNYLSQSEKLKERFDFALLTGNCLTHDWHGSVEDTIKYFRNIMDNFRFILKSNSRMLIDTRNFDYMLSFKASPLDRIIDEYCSMNNVCYHGLGNGRIAFPAYISEELVVYHYYDEENKVWSANDFFPTTHAIMQQIFSGIFVIERVFWDYQLSYTGRSHFVQYIVKPLA